MDVVLVTNIFTCTLKLLLVFFFSSLQVSYECFFFTYTSSFWCFARSYVFWLKQKTARHKTRKRFMGKKLSNIFLKEIFLKKVLSRNRVRLFCRDRVGDWLCNEWHVVCFWWTSDIKQEKVDGSDRFNDQCKFELLWWSSQFDDRVKSMIGSSRW